MTSKKMCVVFDANTVADSLKSGVGYYTHGIILALAKEYPEICFIGHYHNFFNQKKVLNLPSAPNISYRVSRIIPLKLLNLIRRVGIEIPYELLSKTRADVHFFPNFMSYPSFFKTPCVTTIHDLAFVDRPETVSARNQKDLLSIVPQSLKRSKMIVTVSEVTKKRIEEIYHYTKPIYVTQISPSLDLKNRKTKTKIRELFKIPRDYILFVGTIEPRKNVKTLIRAYKQLSADLKNKYSLVLAGNKGWDSDELIDYIEKMRRDGDSIVITGYIDEQLKPSLYQHASLFVFPSWYEGYGIPPLESLQAGTPIIVSDIPILHEVCKATALYFNPHSADKLTLLIDKILRGKINMNEHMKKAQKLLDTLKWEKAAEKTMDCFLGVKK